MDRLLSLKKSDLNSTSNTSVISELGYETAHDSSASSLYFSVLDSSADDTLNESYHIQAMVEDETVSVADLHNSSRRRPLSSTSSTETIENSVISRSQSSNLVPTLTVPVEINSSQANEIANPESDPEMLSIESNENPDTMSSEPMILFPTITVEPPNLLRNTEEPMEIDLSQANEIAANAEPESEILSNENPGTMTSQPVILLPTITVEPPISLRNTEEPFDRDFSQANEMASLDVIQPEVCPIESNENTGASTLQSTTSVPQPTVHFAPYENVVQPILTPVSDVPDVENLLPSNGMIEKGTNTGLGQTIDPNLQEVTISNATHVSSSSNVIQGLYVNVAINTQQINQITAPEQPTRPPVVNRAMRLQNQNPYQTRAARYTMGNLGTNIMPRRQTNMSRRTLRDIQNEAISTSSRSTGPSNLGQPNITAPKESHVCEVCKKAFPLRSTLLVHKSCHQSKSSVANICKHCDRSFQKTIALDNHLKEKCEKIPAAARRKLLTEEFNARK